jgi:hypothetical protein
MRFIETRGRRLGWFVDGSLVAATVMSALLAFGVARGQVIFTSAGPTTWASVVAAPISAPAAPSSAASAPIMTDGAAAPLASQEVVALGENRRGQITIRQPDPTSDARLLDLLVVTDDGQARPVDNLIVRATARMPGMDPIESVGVAGAPGHYMLALPLSMPGTWQVELTILDSGLIRSAAFQLRG